MRFPDKFWWRLRQPVALALLLAWAGSAGWASDPEAPKPCTRQSTSDSVSQSASPREDRDSAELPGTHPPEENRPARNGVAAEFHLVHWERSLVADQKAIWTSPLHLHALHQEDKNWLVPSGIGTLGLVATDQDIMRHFGRSPRADSNRFSNYGLAAMAGSGASLYLRGATANDGHSRETGLLAEEAAGNAVIVGEAMKLAFQRPPPNAAHAGSFGAGGTSFPSEHSLAAWSIASVIVHEYPGPFTKLLAYGAASGIGLSRVEARQHFPSDVVAGGALGYLIGQEVYRAHHDPELPGASARDFGEDPAEKAVRARTPSELGSPYVPLDSWVYAAFDRLAALGYAPSAYANLRPWTRMECARIVAAAGDDLGSDDLRSNDSDLGSDDAHPTEADRLYAALKAEFSAELGRFNGSRTGMQAFQTTYGTMGFFPKILIAPGYSQDAPVATEIDAMANTIRAMALVDSPPSTTVAAAIANRGVVGNAFATSSNRTILCYPQETFYDTGIVPTGVTLSTSGTPVTTQFNANSVGPYSQWVAGAIAAKDLAQGYWWSPSNTQVDGMLGPDVTLYASILDPLSDTNNLNAAGIVTVFNAFGTGLRVWGNRSAEYPASTAPDNFISVRRTMDIIEGQGGSFITNSISYGSGGVSDSHN